MPRRAVPTRNCRSQQFFHRDFSAPSGRIAANCAVVRPAAENLCLARPGDRGQSLRTCLPLTTEFVTLSEKEIIMKKLPITKMQQIKTTRAVTIIAHYCLVAVA
jgi:hypothetical protein